MAAEFPAQGSQDPVAEAVVVPLRFAGVVIAFFTISTIIAQASGDVQGILQDQGRRDTVRFGAPKKAANNRGKDKNGRRLQKKCLQVCAFT
ncbi:MAG: hypothetical protein ACYDBT_05150 [Desulfobulbaceae bacterium]